MTPKREKLVRAAYKAWAEDRAKNGGLPTISKWESLASWQSEWFAVVDALLAELREPDEGMLEAGRYVLLRKDVIADGVEFYVKDVLQAALDEVM